MSKTKSNVHPAHYKVAGRERQGEEVLHTMNKALLAQSRAEYSHASQTPWPAPQEERMPEQETLDRAKQDEAEGKSPSTQAGEFVREEIDHIREGKHGARSTKQAIAIGLSKARRAGVKLGSPTRGSKRTRQQAARDTAKGRNPGRRTSAKRSRATSKALRREGRSAASRSSLARQARSSARRRTARQRSASARRAARTRSRR
jgi:Family of unknown function (DUF6496)